MRSYDLSPLFRSTIGFDRWADLFEAANRVNPSASAFPPYNIEKRGDEAYRITMAVAGFGESDIEVTVQENLLVISGKLEDSKASEISYLHRGIAARVFERRFNLAEHVIVEGARLANGLLEIDLVHEVPEAKKPRRIEIGTGAAGTIIENKKAA
ncbi:MAG: Hsp20 family protein [Proteobacteria bacterium]|nr:Hsp20 family protein [Pseudomonadota bacterium]